MNLPNTLNEARELLEAAEAKIEGLTLAVKATDGFLEDAGIIRTTAEDGTIRFESPRLKELIEQNNQFEKTIEKLTIDNKTLADFATGKDTLIEGYKSEVAALNAAAKTVEARAREMLANSGGAPLPVDGTDVIALTTADALRGQLAAEKDPVKVFEIYKQLKAIEAKK